MIKQSKPLENSSINRTYVRKIENNLNEFWYMIFMLDLFNSKVKSKAIRFLIQNNEATISQLAREAKISKSRVSEVLREFEKAGILKSKRIGRSILYQVRKDDERVLFILTLLERESTNIERIKKQILPILKKHGVLKAGIFGSVVRGEAKSESDVDILVELPKGKSLFDLVRLELQLQEKLKRKVDLVTYDSVHPLLREIIFNEEVRIYEKR